MTTPVIAILTAAAVVLLLAATRRGRRRGEIAAKATASACFVVAGLVHWAVGDPVATWLVVGLAACAAGDLLLLFERLFDFGLAAFLAGHLAYIAAFVAAAPPDGWPLAPLVPLGGAAVVVGGWLWPHLGRRRIPVAVYIVVISVMVWGAFAAWRGAALPWTAAAGAALFYLSDLTVARHRFVTAAFANRAVGLPVYYAGQLLIALSV